MTVKAEELKHHITTQCEELEWAEKNNKETKGSLGLLSHLIWQKQWIQKNQCGPTSIKFCCYIE